VKKKILILLPIVAIVIAAGLYMLGYIPTGNGSEEVTTGEFAEVDEHDEPLPDRITLYLALQPPFVVNFTHLGTLRYLQISLELMYHDQVLLDRVENNMPAIRNALILLLSHQKYEKLNSLSGKEAIREEIMVAVNKLIIADDESYEAGEVYITNFVMQ